MAALLSGVNASVVGVLATALYSPVWTSSVVSKLDFAIAAIGFLLLTRWKIPPLAVDDRAVDAMEELRQGICSPRSDSMARMRWHR
jgi:hypothetical protein